ncbi:uncharacterized protein F4812DRAFT_424529 [Daldinia caldariorum]|uniref:uncharacterized protein n=1 Tax=Daldinia caldariorum TaxID=326644 RepID=UPI002008411E|nr:uncharacterized protein F4812DRAFT_424529 [Daldinia caldariorum]KAI1468744.1 hypothetical protein F4812DRAFT_424529 [Daldinia caldariorum]
MDWVRRRWRLSDGDLGNFEYANRKCKVIRLGYNGEGQRRVQHWDLSSDVEWLDWFGKEKLISEESRNNTTSVILGSRKEENDCGLSYLPFSRPIFERILQRFFIHDSIARTILRNYAATFSRTYLPIENSTETALVYNCRSSAHWEDDLTLSVTYFPSTGRTYAVFYGCNNHAAGKTIMERISNRFIKSSEDSFCHPMLSVGIFAEIERFRMRELVLSRKTALQDTIDKLQAHGYGSLTGSRSHVDPWLNIYAIRNGLECWLGVLASMITHIDELAAACDQVHDDNNFYNTGRRIKDRLAEIHAEYLDLIRDCTMIIDGMTLATNLALARDNMSESKQMKTIAVVTMVFLPATFVATLFSMTFFDLNSSYAWLYPCVTIPLTVLVIGVYIYVVVRPRQRQMKKASGFDSGDEGSGRNTRSCCWV